MHNLKSRLAKTPILGRTLLGIKRLQTGWIYVRVPLLNLCKWLFTSRETTNFTYALEQSNKQYLASLIADITGKEFAVIMSYIEELEADNTLRAHIAEATSRSDFFYEADNEVHFGRRVGWYALVRALKPKTIIETGVDKGLGSCVLAAALKKNHQEGHEGRFYGTDINPHAGYLLSGEYASYGKILYGDSIESLKNFEGVIDLFINDSDHSADYEAQEYLTVADKLSEQAVILGDNSHCTNKLLEFSLAAGRHFIFFGAKPENHWYPGAGIGISFKRQK